MELRGVPYLLFNRQSLSRLATVIGKPISLAPETERKENFEVARLWVKVNLMEELPTRLVSGFSNGRETEISVAYPWLPSKCQTCGKYGHDTLACSNRSTRGAKDTQASIGRDPKPARSRSRGPKASSSSRSGRLQHARRMENVIYRVKDPKQSLSITEMENGHLPLHEATTSEVTPVQDVEKNSPPGPDKDIIPDLPGASSEAVQEAPLTQDHQFPLSIQSISLDRQFGQTSVVVFHEDIVGDSAALSDQREDSSSPFFLVNNMKSSRKATKP